MSNTPTVRLIYFLEIEFLEFLTYFPIIFSHFVGYSHCWLVHWLCGNLVQCNPIHLFLLLLLVFFWVISKKLTALLVSWNFSIMFSSCSFQFLVFMFKFLIHFELIFEDGSNFVPLNMSKCSSPSNMFWNDSLLPIICYWRVHQKSIYYKMGRFMSGLSVPLFFCFYVGIMLFLCSETCFNLIAIHIFWNQVVWCL